MGDNMIDRQVEREQIAANIQAELDALNEVDQRLELVYALRFPKRRSWVRWIGKGRK